MTTITLAKKLSMAVVGTAFIAMGSIGTAEASTIILESATFNSEDLSSGYSVTPFQSLGWRFQIDDFLQVTEIGGNFGNFYEPGNIFGAIVSLDSPNALPSGSPNSLVNVLGETTFTRELDTDTLTPLSVLLNPGNYALIFGSGQFGATGSTNMPFTGQVNFPGSSYFFGNTNNTNWMNGGFSNARFIVKGEAITQSQSVPEPTLVTQLQSVPEPTLVTQSRSVPEPTSVLGLLVFTALSVSQILQRQGYSKNTDTLEHENN
jgi:hypothetical protein